MKNCFAFALFFLGFSNIPVFSQQVAGEWYGVGNVNRRGYHDSYLSELILNQKGNKVTGEFNYYFRGVKITTKITGIFIAGTRTLELKAHPVLAYKAKSINGADCPMEGSFTLQVSRVETSLRGQFNPTNVYRYTCPAINIKLVKQPKKPLEKPDEGKGAEDVEEEEEVVQKKIEQSKIEELTTAKRETLQPVDPNIEIIQLFHKRTIERSPVIEVNADSLKISLYDNGEIDGDTISVFHNRKLIASHQLLMERAFTITIPLDTSVHEISMFAENLGSIPPNTALCVIYAGEERFEMSMASNYIKNATIRFRKKDHNAPRKE